MRSHLNWWHRVLTWGRRVPASVLSSWGSMPQLGNEKMYCICLSRHRALSSKCRRGDASPPGEDAIPQVRTRFLLAMKKINDRLMKKINDRLMMINVQKKGSRSEPYLILFCSFTFHRFQIPNDRVVIGEGDGVVDAYSEGFEVRGAEYIVNAHVDSIAIE